jgi:hypothetical protein
MIFRYLVVMHFVYRLKKYNTVDDENKLIFTFPIKKWNDTTNQTEWEKIMRMGIHLS